MRVFVTGATGFVGSAIAQDLLQAGHEVLGLVRNETKAAELLKAGGEVYHGNLDQPESLVKGALESDAIIHTAFNHDFSRYKQNCEDDRKIISVLGQAIAGSSRPLVITSGTGIMNYGRILTEDDVPPPADQIPRAASEEAARDMAAKGVKAFIVRLPPTVHGPGDHGFIPMIIDLSKDKGVSAYIGDGQNQWPAVHRLDAASLYRLIIETQPAQMVYHAVAEEGIVFREIAAAIGKGLGLPVESKQGEDAEKHFRWFRHFAGIDSPASAEKTSAALGWQFQQPGLMQDLNSGIYFSQ